MDRKTIEPIFSLALSISGYWWYLRDFRQDLDSMFNESEHGLVAIDVLTQPSTEETALLIVSTALFAYGLYKGVLFIKTGKEIDDEAAIDNFIKTHDREFSRKTNILIWSVILIVFAAVVWYAISIS